jgi:hypothetical protein
MVERLLDVYITGPLQIYMGLHIQDNPTLRFFMILTGICTILYNLHNYLYINKQSLTTNYYGFLTHSLHGKRQLHRLYNILVMYPIFYIVYQRYPTPLSILFLLNIIIGWIYNTTNFIKLIFRES